MIHKGRLLYEGRRLSDYGITDESAVHMVLELRAGPCTKRAESGPFHIIVSFFKTLYIPNVDSLKTIGDVKAEIERLESYPTSLQVLSKDTRWRQEPLRNNDPLPEKNFYLKLKILDQEESVTVDDEDSGSSDEKLFPRERHAEDSEAKPTALSLGKKSSLGSKKSSNGVPQKRMRLNKN